MIRAVDLFCGAGGTSQGLVQACKSLDLGLDLAAVNHWPRAVASHELNHPNARHFCAEVGALNPKRAFPEGSVDLILAGVECTHHSRARGKAPVSDQRRSSGWHVVDWAEKLRAREILVENVREFEDWGPVDSEGRPIKELKGQTFDAWVLALKSLGYTVQHRVLNCADYGDPTSRRRLFVRASLEGSIEWPEPTHGTEERPYRTARECIDLSDLGTSIFRRRKKLAKRTIDRIAEGIRRFCGDMAEPFLVMLYGTGTVRSLDRPLPTVTAQGQHIAIAHPFLLPHRYGGKAGSMVDSIDEPYRTITASNGGDSYIATPFLVPHFGERKGQQPRTHDLDDPLPTVTATKGAGSLVTPFLLKYYGKTAPRPLDAPVPTVTARDHFALVTPEGHGLDIYFRMLRPDELAKAQGFPEGYQFHGTKTQVVRMIGNAVPINTAAALCRSILGSAQDAEAAA